LHNFPGKEIGCDDYRVVEPEIFRQWGEDLMRSGWGDHRGFSGARGGSVTKSEARDPKSERNPKSDTLQSIATAIRSLAFLLFVFQGYLIMLRL
jgi:hypothetical protein